MSSNETKNTLGESGKKVDDVEKSKTMLDAFELNFQEVIPEIFIDKIPLSVLSDLGVVNVEDLRSMGMELTHDLVKTYLLMIKIDREVSSKDIEIKADDADDLDSADEKIRVLQNGFRLRRHGDRFVKEFRDFVLSQED